MWWFGFHDFDTLVKLTFILYLSQHARRDQIFPTMHFTYLTQTFVHTQQMSIIVLSFKRAPLHNYGSEELRKMHVLSVIGCLITGGTWPSWPSRNPGGNRNRTSRSKGKYSYPLNIPVFHLCKCVVCIS